MHSASFRASSLPRARGRAAGEGSTRRKGEKAVRAVGAVGSGGLACVGVEVVIDSALTMRRAAACRKKRDANTHSLLQTNRQPAREQASKQTPSPLVASNDAPSRIPAKLRLAQRQQAVPSNRSTTTVAGMTHGCKRHPQPAPNLSKRKLLPPPPPVVCHERCMPGQQRLVVPMSLVDWDHLLSERPIPQ
ncbi:hypothetical protein GGTG_02925 [Gaeumannomyces tritici R3-111a-1]|uniref:Uncharacterized protein n=1 Tax=Gaeumannomyces tritici (strain R3-111a-1) TaxID=644352 RepID=J3NNR7_GAET3|nr:hypothetical protein GGTG_02925 [Gaeumannomyces tritici R3-111a-1]EJT77820.1 hypothetical protein GGTG_02925 [Gaeumannomyces tritici R3-111a-1]